MERKYIKKKSARKRYIVATVVVIFVAIAYFSSAKVFHFWPFQKETTQNSESSPSPKPSSPSPKNTAVTEKGDAQPSIDPGKTTDQVPVNPAMTANIITLEESGQAVHFTATVSNSPTVGICVVTFSNPNDRPVTQQVNATVNNSLATCGPLSIPAGEFSYLGTWQVSFHYYLGSQQATAQGNITIQ